jgi:hypothetical protein
MGLVTMLALAKAPADTPCGALGRDRFERLHNQASLQVGSRTTGEPTRRHLEPARAAGYALLPPTSPGDIFFDLEGDPYVEDGGLEYLWGWWTEEVGYESVWAHDSTAEKAALEQFVDRAVELRSRYPDLHIYHYAPHERSKLGSLAAAYATREEEIDELMRADVLVDLYAIVRQAMQVGEDSYSLKKLERHHGFARLETRVREGGGSIVAYEAWLDSGDDELLEAIRAYNEEDCRSTQSLLDWLRNDMLPEAASEFGIDFADYRDPEVEEPFGPPDWLPEVERLIERLVEGRPESDIAGDPDAEERQLLAYLLLYHRRESKPTWWRYFDLRGKSLIELMEDRNAVAGLELDESVRPVPFKLSLDYSFTFPAQEFRLNTGDAQDPTTGLSYKVVHLADDRIVLRCSKTRPPPAPVALVEGSPVNTSVLREALMELAASILDADDRYPAARTVLRKEPPRLASGVLGETIEDLTAAALGLDHSVLPVQGPPGTGKTFRAARVIREALHRGLRVGVTAPSHAAIQNLLHEIEECAGERGQGFNGVYRGTNYASSHEFVHSTGSNGDVTEEYQLVAGTAWLFARPEHRQAFDLLFIDEAGQFSLANAAAAAMAARSVVLLGDPQQLPQVNQAQHPGGSGASVLEHILDGANTLASDQGVLFTESWRMHPDVCRFVSERSYDGRLYSRPECAQRRVDASSGVLTGVGLRSVAVKHEARSQASPEEAAAILAMCSELLAGARVTDADGATRPIQPRDILVVAPYNLAVRSIREIVPDGVRVGTVDRFQGLQAPVVFYAMTCSSGDDAPRGADFLFDAHRLNVATSRAQCLAVLVHSPRLIDTDCSSVRTMELLDGVCRFLEMATAVPGHSE